MIRFTVSGWLWVLAQVWHWHGSGVMELVVFRITIPHELQPILPRGSISPLTELLYPVSSVERPQDLGSGLTMMWMPSWVCRDIQS